MRLTSLHLRNVPPVRRFDVPDLSDIVVIAGPNGVGKTRLVQAVLDQLRTGGVNPDIGGTIRATSSDESEQWGKGDLDLSLPEDMQKVYTTLSVNRRRRNLQSSLINFESDRTIRNLQPYPFSFDMPDPSEEQIGWDMPFTPLSTRYQDTIHAMHRMVEAQRRGISTQAVRLKKEGRESMKLDFTDPMDPFREIFRQLLAPKELADLTMGDQRLRYLDNGNELPFDSLSSGEREVVNIAFDFLLRRPRDCIVVFDEPELHLHPELSYRLVQVLQRIGKNNQFIFTTHSPDIITASLDRTVVFLAPADNDAAEPVNQAVEVTDADDSHQALKLLGQSIGIVALGRKIVLVEGDSSSLDKQVYGSILQERHPDLVLVPSGGKHAIESFDLVHTAVLSESLWGVEFFMLCDGDSRPAGDDGTSERFAVLPRYHLENYFLDEQIWAQVFAQLEPEDSWRRSATEIRTKLRELASEQISYAVALRTAAEVRQGAGNVNVMPRACNGLTSEQLVAAITATARAEEERLGTVLDVPTIEGAVSREYERIRQSLDTDTDEWKALVPGRPLLGRFAGEANLALGHAKSLYVNTVMAAEADTFAEIEAIFDRFAAMS
jgi:ABC-type branched-subunit amino acid transport system ATPase component